MSELRSPEEAGVTSFPTTAYNIAACNWCGRPEIDPALAVVPGAVSHSMSRRQAFLGADHLNFCTAEHRKEFFRGRNR